MRIRTSFGKGFAIAATALLSFGISTTAQAATVDGTDSIFLSGRTDVTIPPLGGSDPSFPLVRHGGVALDFLQETFPDPIAASGGQLFSFTATGCINFFNGIGCSSGAGIDGFSPDGGSPDGSNLSSLGGISGYQGPEGALVGLFLDNSVPSAGAPPTLNFQTGGMGTDFANLAPALGQIFFIGDGKTSANVVQQFLAPTGTTRLFLGIPDGFSFDGTPGAYEDNDGSFSVNVAAVPTPAMLPGLLSFGMNIIRKKRKKEMAAA